MFHPPRRSTLPHDLAPATANNHTPRSSAICDGNPPQAARLPHPICDGNPPQAARLPFSHFPKRHSTSPSDDATVTHPQCALPAIEFVIIDSSCRWSVGWVTGGG
ncbi:hypothetical protein TIFTF001_052180 [Ficus carica]|uniref:Uncharacterized protein n=1 Tax=Ficus carica TaxID=3494 RepID=A0AA88JGM5_FICCA|nr:hypothetical protein TIFTF001_052177 [Ficus carica]GMN73436.1 hypothetical protein TIFTF001_052178 [Ficus carica]GMN73441.1 hypothetical protein TIFTF001_052179 [Ficus carica]GMN73445.1 hypothetical protein TIFTF001_052180 [Ficus carica]